MRRPPRRPSRPDDGPVAPPGRAPTGDEGRPIGVRKLGLQLLVDVDPERPDGPGPEGLYRARRRDVSCHRRLLPSAGAASDAGVLPALGFPRPGVRIESSRESRVEDDRGTGAGTMATPGKYGRIAGLVL